jgi:hypothetical protein
MSINTDVIERLAVALQKYTTSASANLGSDCMLHAMFAQRILHDNGISSRLVVGEAAWRVGPGDGDVFVHSPQLGGHTPAGAKSLAYHAWLEMGPTILDFTTHSLRKKASDLDAMDGGKTDVQWCPSYLLLKKSQTLSLNDVRKSANTGVVCYREIPDLYEYIVTHGGCQKVDESDLYVLRLIFAKPDLRVIGPNHYA